MGSLTLWRVLSKRIDRQDAGSVYCILVVEREGRKREAVVSGATWDEIQPGAELALNEEARR